MGSDAHTPVCTKIYIQEACNLENMQEDIAATLWETFAEKINKAQLNAVLAPYKVWRWVQAINFGNFTSCLSCNYQKGVSPERGGRGFERENETLHEVHKGTKLLMQAKNANRKNSRWTSAQLQGTVKLHAVFEQGELTRIFNSVRPAGTAMVLLPPPGPTGLLAPGGPPWHEFAPPTKPVS